LVENDADLNAALYFAHENHNLIIIDKLMIISPPIEMWEYDYRCCIYMDDQICLSRTKKCNHSIWAVCKLCIIQLNRNILTCPICRVNL